MIEQVGKTKSRCVACELQSVVELFAKRNVERAIDEVIGVLDTDLPARIGKIACTQVSACGSWPCCQFHVEQLGRPAAPRQRPSTDGKDEPGVIECRMIDPRHPQVRRAAHIRHILHVFRQHPRPGLEHQDAAAAGGVCNEEVLCHNATERATTDDDGIKGARSSTDNLSSTVERLLQVVEQKTPYIIQCKRRGFRSQQRCHDVSLLAMSPGLRCTAPCLRTTTGSGQCVQVIASSTSSS